MLKIASIVVCLLMAAGVGALIYFEVPAYVTLLALSIAVFVALFLFVVLPHIIEARSLLNVSQVSAALNADGKPGSSWWTWLFGFKAQVCFFVSILAEALPQLVYKLEGYDLTNALGPKIGSIVGILVLAAGAYFHAKGLVQAAATPPADKGPSI